MNNREISRVLSFIVKVLDTKYQVHVLLCILMMFLGSVIYLMVTLLPLLASNREFNGNNLGSSFTQYT